MLSYVVLAAADYFFQKWQHIKQLKMSKDEVKREYKEMEGDPQIKSKRKQLHQEMANNETMEQTRKSSVVVTNPTHLAIAIYYEEDDNEMPRVLAKGEDHVRELIQSNQTRGRHQTNKPRMIMDRTGFFRLLNNKRTATLIIKQNLMS